MFPAPLGGSARSHSLRTGLEGSEGAPEMLAELQKCTEFGLFGQSL